MNYNRLHKNSGAFRLPLLLTLAACIFIMPNCHSPTGLNNAEEEANTQEQQSSEQETAKLSVAVPAGSSQSFTGHYPIAFRVEPKCSLPVNEPMFETRTAWFSSKVWKILFRRIISPNAP